MKILLSLLLLLLLHACKHPLAIDGEGDIIERLFGQRGCSLEEFQAAAPPCAENEVTDEAYQVSYEGVPRPGWRFVGWEGTDCSAESVTPYCDYDVAAAWVVVTDTTWPDTVFPPKTAVFRQLPPASEQNTWATKRNISSDHAEGGGCSIDGKLYVIGGRENNASSGRGNFTTLVERYDPATDQWSLRSPLPSPRILVTSAVVDGKCYVLGGQSSPRNVRGPAVATVEIYDPETDSWSTGTDIPTGRFAAAAASFNGKIYVFGGGTRVTGAGLGLTGVLEIYDPATNSWTTGASMGRARFGHGGAAADGWIYAIGGSLEPNDAALTVVERYNPATDSWQNRAPLAGGKGFLTTATVADRIYATGGASIYTTRDSATYEYVPASNSWNTRASIPSAPYGGVALVAEDRMYVLGGVSNSSDDAGSANLVYTPSFP